MMAVLRVIRNWVFLPFGIVIGVFVFLVLAIMFLATVPQSIWRANRWRSKLRRDRRYRNPEIRPDTISGGTLIVDSPTVGWGITHCWWTPDDILNCSPTPIPTEDDRHWHVRSDPDRLEFPFDRWVNEKYLCENAGTAILIGYRRGDALANRIANRNDIPIVKTWSGPIAFFPEQKTDP